MFQAFPKSLALQHKAGFIFTDSQTVLFRSSRQSFWIYCALSGCNSFLETLWKGLRLPHSDFSVTKTSTARCHQVSAARLTVNLVSLNQNHCGLLVLLGMNRSKHNRFPDEARCSVCSYCSNDYFANGNFNNLGCYNLTPRNSWLVSFYPQGTFAIVSMQSPTFILDGAHLSLGLRLSSALTTLELTHIIFVFFCPTFYSSALWT